MTSAVPRREFVMLPPVASFLAILCQSHFFISAAIIFAFTFLISYGITYNSVNDRKHLWVLFDENEIINILLTTTFMSVAIFVFGLRMARKRILTGAQAPLAPEAYKSNIFKIALLFSLGIPTWKKRLFFFVLNCYALPMCLVIAGLAAGCQVQKRKDELSTCYIHDLHPYLVIDASYRSVLITIMYTMNYLASYNAAQPELVELTQPRELAAIIPPTYIPTGQVVLAIPMSTNSVYQPNVDEAAFDDLQFDPSPESPHFAQHDALYESPSTQANVVFEHPPEAELGRVDSNEAAPTNRTHEMDTVLPSPSQQLVDEGNADKYY